VVVQHILFDSGSTRGVNGQSFVLAIAHRIANKRTRGTEAHVVKMQTIFAKLRLTTRGQFRVVDLHGFVVPLLTSCEPIPRNVHRTIQVQNLRVDGDTVKIPLLAVILVRALVKTNHTPLIDGHDLHLFCSVVIIGVSQIGVFPTSSGRHCPSFCIAISNQHQSVANFPTVALLDGDGLAMIARLGKQSPAGLLYTENVHFAGAHQPTVCQVDFNVSGRIVMKPDLQNPSRAYLQLGVVSN
jgi:hypothetical protein